MSREAHEESINIAIAEITGLVNRLTAADEKQSEAFLAVVTAVGDTPNNNYAQDALAMTNEIGETLTELFARCRQIEEALLAYRGGF